MRKPVKSSKPAKGDPRPPNHPWQPLQVGRSAGAALSFYYSDPTSRVPVRQVSRPATNRADPNIETMTYGLFSKCERAMRAGVVNRGMEYLLFCTNRAGPRVLTGYYRISWYFKQESTRGSRGRKRLLDDFPLAASDIRFVNPGFPLSELTGYLKGFRLDKPFRTYKYVDDEAARKLVSLIKRTPDATGEYLEDIRRLEEFNIKTHGRRYLHWEAPMGFNWDIAAKYVHPD